MPFNTNAKSHRTQDHNSNATVHQRTNNVRKPGVGEKSTSSHQNNYNNNKILTTNTNTTNSSVQNIIASRVQRTIAAGAAAHAHAHSNSNKSITQSLKKNDEKKNIASGYEAVARFYQNTYGINYSAGKLGGLEPEKSGQNKENNNNSNNNNNNNSNEKDGTTKLNEQQTHNHESDKTPMTQNGGSVIFHFRNVGYNNSRSAEDGNHGNHITGHISGDNKSEEIKSNTIINSTNSVNEIIGSKSHKERGKKDTILGAGNNTKSKDPWSSSMHSHNNQHSSNNYNNNEKHSNVHADLTLQLHFQRQECAKLQKEKDELRNQTQTLQEQMRTMTTELQMQNENLERMKSLSHELSQNLSLEKNERKKESDALLDELQLHKQRQQKLEAGLHTLGVNAWSMEKVISTDETMLSQILLLRGRLTHARQERLTQMQQETEHIVTLRQLISTLDSL